mgnify:CR=1 FL=1|jgi:hypothetical protein
MSMDIPVKEISELLDEVSGKMPKLLTSVIDAFYSAESGKKMGQAVGNLYKELIDSGIPKEDALNMARDYLTSLQSVTGNLAKNDGKK